MQDVEKQLIERAKALFAEGKVQRVVGWKKGLFEEDVTPGVFNSVEELEKDFVFNKYCASNLSKYPARARPGRSTSLLMIIIF